MAAFLDARIPLIFGEVGDAGPTDAVLREGAGDALRGCDWFEPALASAHPADCACCTPRNSAGQALSRLILARGRGSGLFFNRVIVVARTKAGRAEVLAALERDPLVSCVFRQGQGSAQRPR